MIPMRPEQELVPYAPGRLEGDPVLVLAPHPDDEVFGCGGFLAAAAEEGRTVQVVVLTDGAAQGEEAVRRAESVEAARRLGTGEPLFMGLPDRGLEPELPALREAIAGALGRTEPALVLVPSPAEVHPDHRATALAAYRLLADPETQLRGDLKLVTYEVSAVLHPNLLLDVSVVWDRVLHAARAFASQLEFHPYLEILDALATARRLTLGPAVRRAEAYFRTPLSLVRRQTVLEWAAAQGPSAGLETGETEAAEREELAARLRREIARLEEELARCRQHLREAEEDGQRLRAAEGRLSELEATLQAITRSRTWRLHLLLERLRGRRLT